MVAVLARGLIVMNVTRFVVFLAVFAYVAAGMYDPNLVPEWLKFTPQTGCVH